MSAIPQEVRFNYQDLLQIPDDGRRYEVVEGDLFVSPSPRGKHQLIVSRLVRFLEDHVSTRRLGRVYAAPADVKFSEESVVEPDIVYVSKEKSRNVYETFIDVVPDLIVEVLSEGTRQRDFGEKMKLYARHGVSHYWIADPEARRMWVYELASGKYSTGRELDSEATFEPPLFPGLALRLAEVFDFSPL